MELTERCHCHYSSEISNGRSAFLLLIRVILALIFCCPRYHMVAYWHFNVGLEFFTSLSDSSCGGNYWILFFFFFRSCMVLFTYFCLCNGLFWTSSWRNHCKSGEIYKICHWKVILLWSLVFPIHLQLSITFINSWILKSL